MKILQIIPGFWVGGAEVMCKNLILSLSGLGHSVTAVSLYPERTPISQELEEAGIPVRYLDKKLGLDLSMIPKLTAIFREERPQAVHSHLDCVKYVAAAARLAGVKSCIHTVHSMAEKECEGTLQKIINTAYFRLGLSTPVALSLEVRDSIARFYGLKKERIPVIPNGIDLGKCLPKESYALANTAKLLHVGRFDTPKNHVGMLKAFQLLRKTHPDSHLTLVGDGDLRPQIEDAIRQLELGPWVTLAGMQKNVYPYLQEADVFVLPSVYEGNPMSIIEAMACGLPIAASRVGGIPDMVEDQVSALLTDPEPEAICHAWCRLLEDESLREKLGRRARQDSARFSGEEMARRYAKLCQ